MLKKFVSSLSILALLLSGCSDIPLKHSKEETVQSLSEKVIRFHVLANSDSNSDQELKQKVKDEVIASIMPIMKESKNLQESRKLLQENDEKIKNIALKVIKERGFNYSVQTSLSRENFPVKRYGSIVFPQGEYEAYKIIIGEGRGQNWWCVMFPPICFIDITKGAVKEQETEEEMKRYLSEDEFQAIQEEDLAAKAKNNSEKKDKINDTSKSNKNISDKSGKNKLKTQKKNTENTLPNQKGNDSEKALSQDNSGDNNIIFKFKLMEVFQSLFN
ncbi:stage II sporulation protein R [Clostridium polynesiense]|uniref:stage II sporulation protein R n=1 Tax=Clostridium polynesiense TaxID=1325933 RepID=UPI0009E244D0|nr:stage II sporulation protein R [Clostridium polynesiense]